MRCALSAVAGAVVATLFLTAFHSPLGRGQRAWAQQGKASAGKAAGDGVTVSSGVKVDADNISPLYSNFVRVTGTAEEVILDFALNPQPFAAGEQSVKANDRQVLSMFTAKRLSVALKMTLDHHEDKFGPIELDVRKRAKPAVKDQ